MPILDPSQFREFVSKCTDLEGEGFFLKFLLNASKSIDKNIKTIKSHVQFKKDLHNGLPFLNKKFNINIQLNNDDLKSKNCYEYLYSQLPNNKIERCSGITFKVSLRTNSLFFQLKSYSIYHSWYLTDNPVAILAIEIRDIEDINYEEYFNFINLEIDLMSSQEYTLVLCANFTDPKPARLFLGKTIKTHHFDEIHFDLHVDKREEEYIQCLEILTATIDSIDCYFYFYSFSSNNDIKISNLIIKLKEKPFFRSIICTKYAFKTVFYDEIAPFPYCKNGFDYDRIRIQLSNIPLYDTDDDINDFTPTYLSGNTFAYINSNDFLNLNEKRVKVLIYNSIKYADFDDIHFLNPSFYVDDLADLMEIDSEAYKQTSNLIDKANEKYEELQSKKFKQEKFGSIQEKTKLQNVITYVICALKIFTKGKIELYENQVFAVYDACMNIAFNQSNENDIKGIIYEVQTGEGKSYIIQVIAAVLALIKKKVHIITSNIFLANRDYYNSYEFFQFLGLSSAVLLHKDELPKFNKNNIENNDDDDNDTYSKERYPKNYYGGKAFKNSSNMNIIVCGFGKNNRKEKKSKIVFSTLINYEALYLRMMEKCPSLIDTYFDNCSLIVDEADSILIDDLTNGTILSRPMNSNGKEILVYVYQCKMNNKKPEEVLNKIKKIWPKCTDIKVRDIEKMYQEIDIVLNEEFTNGKKYSIETIRVHVPEDDLNVIQRLSSKIEKVKNKFDDIKDKAIETAINSIKKVVSKKSKELNELNDDNEIKEEEEDNNNEIFNNIINDQNDMKYRKFIVPFDYDHKGILEPNKEFSGFIQQFIAIKEIFNDPERNKNMFINDVSMSYLYVSHPIFVKLYKSVCGFTGTIGNEYDKSIFKKHYGLETSFVPRNNLNNRVDINAVICSTADERNLKIVDEICLYQKKGNPVLVIFQDLNEIDDVLNLLNDHGITNVNVFNGKDPSIKPDFIAGKKGAVSLGTNFCGRGTDIKNVFLPLHVIISFFTSNVRVMEQAFGRTGRKGNKGTVHIICQKDQFISPVKEFMDDDMREALNDFDCKNRLQIEFIEKFRENREWIFSSKMHSQIIKPEYIEEMRNSSINVNRIVAYNFKFPICMNIDTFLMIQAQKIFSLFNCPNCKYTWMLFRKYLLEMILESWSLLIDKSDRVFATNPQINKSEYLKTKSKKLYEKLCFYLPEKNELGIIETFMWIFKIVLNRWEEKVCNIFPKNLMKKMKHIMSEKFCSLNIGFKPYSLIDKSGSRISTADNDEPPNYIIDPELKYIRKLPKGYSILSITEKIDSLFNKICIKINEVFGSYTGLKFFLRRTLGGCEFGICFDFNLKNLDDENVIGENCLIDKDPLLIFTIFVKSMAPLLAGILIFGLVYLAILSAKIMEYITAFPAKFTETAIKKTIKTVAVYLINNAASNKLEEFCDKICSYLHKRLMEQLDFIKDYKPKVSEYIEILANILYQKDLSDAAEKITSLFNNKLKFNMKSSFSISFVDVDLPMGSFFKIGLLLMLCFAAFLINFNLKRKSIQRETSQKAIEFDKKQDVDEAISNCDDVYTDNSTI